MKYSDAIHKYFNDARFVGEFTKDDNVFTGVAGSKVVGEMIQLQLKVEGNKIVAARFKAHGSVTTIAAAAFVCECVINKNYPAQISSQDIVALLALPQVKLHSALLAEDALANCCRR